MRHLRHKWWQPQASTAALPWKIAIPSLAAALVGLAVFVFLAATSSLIEKAQLTKAPEVLADKARELIQRLGYTAPPGDSAYYFDYDNDFLASVEKTDKPRPQWDEIIRSRPSPLKFWYRQSPESMVAYGLRNEMFIPGDIEEDDPKPTMSGMIDVRLDPQGRLTYFEALPPEREDPPPQSPAPDWNALSLRPAWTFPNSRPTSPCGHRSRLPTCVRRGPANGPDITTDRCMSKPQCGMAGRFISL